MSIYNSLVVKNRELRLIAQDVEEEDDEPEEEPEEEYTPWSSTFERTRNGNVSLQTSYDDENLVKRLKKLMSQANTAIEEQGYNILYISLGLLHWKDPKSDRASRSPMVLVPVLLKRSENRQYYTLSWTGDEIQTNTSLQKKVAELGVILPDFEMGDEEDEVARYLDCVNGAIDHKSDWSISGDAYIDIFNFAKFTMYNDLNPERWPNGMDLSCFPVLDQVFNTRRSSEGAGFSEDDVDARLPAERIFHVMDADSSQIAVIEDIKAGRTMVVEGPPGTGKSQTITNAIAELLAQGKTVLFISEKMAALEVVKDRLDRVGLGDYCMELHSHKTNKKHFLEELKRTLCMQQPTTVNMSSALRDLDELREQLNAYPRDLFKPVLPLGVTPFQLFGISEECRKHFETVGRSMPDFDLPSPERCTEEQWGRAITFIHELRHSIGRVMPLRDNPWYGTMPEVYEPRQQRELLNSIEHSRDSVLEHLADMTSVTSAFGVRTPATLAEFDSILSATSLMMSLVGVDVRYAHDGRWDEAVREIEERMRLISDLEAMDQELVKVFDPSAFEIDASAMLEDFTELSGRFFLSRLINHRYREIKRLVSSNSKKKLRYVDKEVLRRLRKLEERQSHIDVIKSYDNEAASLFGPAWKGPESSIEELSDVLVRMRSLRKMVEDGIILPQWFGLLDERLEADGIVAATESLQALRDGISKTLEDLFTKVGLDMTMFPEGFESHPIDDMIRMFGAWADNIDMVFDWGNHAKLVADNADSIAYPLVKLMEDSPFPLEDMLHAFRGNYAEQVLSIVFAERPSLRTFDGQNHLKRVRRFIELDNSVIRQNQLRLANRMWMQMPRMTGETNQFSEMGILAGEFAKKRRLRSIRRLMNDSGGLIQRIKPCFMMSPLSLAQYLDQNAVKFDVIIFDEASQVKPQDALGCLMRGRQAVVIGDSRQLPPTTFFDTLDKDDVDMEDQTLLPSDIESVLDFFKPRVPTKNLRWHYRSRHESLISLSNREFYDNRLYVYPSPMSSSDWYGLKFVHTSGSLYDRGKSQTNREEARRVVQDAFEHYRTTPERSLGIATFNKNQQQAVEDEIERVLDEDPTLQRFFQKGNHEYCFVKNLETIQGDERDVILISVGYGFDSHGKLSQNFGPVNREGGERRLNVLMTRSREKCVVYSNFRSTDLDVTASTARGVRILKEFLEYAETGDMPVSMHIERDLDSPFEQAVHDFLVDWGHEVRKQVGCAGFRIDLAIVDPKNPGSYIIGVECDGAQYHSSKVARDRDRLRQQVLENLGWRICRVWSTDWYRRPAEAKKKLIDDVAAAVAKGPLTIVRRPVPMPSPPKVEKEPAPLEVTPVAVNDITTGLPPYVKARPAPYRLFEDQGFTDIPIPWLADTIRNIVAVESPIHYEELYRRVRDCTGVKRKGTRITRHFDAALEESTRSGGASMRWKGDFIWNGQPATVRPRVRSDDDPRDIEQIAREELRAAVEHVLQTQYGSTKDGLVSSVAKIFGIKATERNREVIQNKIDRMVEDNMLEVRSNGQIYFR